MRSSLHHYSPRSNRNARPFNQATFEPAAVLAMHIATTVMIFRVVELNRAAAGEVVEA